jgi:hypothetical protein
MMHLSVVHAKMVCVMTRDYLFFLFAADQTLLESFCKLQHKLYSIFPSVKKNYTALSS